QGIAQGRTVHASFGHAIRQVSLASRVEAFVPTLTLGTPIPFSLVPPDAPRPRSFRQAWQQYLSSMKGRMLEILRYPDSPDLEPFPRSMKLDARDPGVLFVLKALLDTMNEDVRSGRSERAARRFYAIAPLLRP